MKDSIFIIGASGHAKVVIDLIENQGLYLIDFIIDDNPNLWNTTLMGYTIIGNIDYLLNHKSPRKGVIAIGNNHIRLSLSKRLSHYGHDLVSALHSSAHIGKHVSIGKGSVLMAGSVINSASILGKNIIVNTQASIDHDCHIEDGVHIGPGSTLCGSVKVGHSTLIGAGAVITPNITIGSEVIIGAGSTVIHDIPSKVTVVGSPARIIH